MIVFVLLAELLLKSAGILRRGGHGSILHYIYKSTLCTLSDETAGKTVHNQIHTNVM